MSKHLHAELTNLTLEDHQVQYYAVNNGRKHIEVNLCFEELKEKFKIRSFKEIQRILDVFYDIDANKDGMIDYEEFCSALFAKKQTPASRQVFDILDQNGSGKLDFAEFCWGIFFLTQASKNGADSEHISTLISAMADAYGMEIVVDQQIPSPSAARDDEKIQSHQRSLSFSDFAKAVASKPQVMEMLPDILVKEIEAKNKVTNEPISPL
eukprot:TRINITY_DN5799_c0_g1_i11.p1 TRINITY_DN5799_c0_g1~~TRINITY_DN5799_c0_g1_i11.p1  ORF type:complete len:210 (+),score=68.80 TRINITY_DN5799_c0_g1_i11:1082-1711(+)